MGGFLPDPSSPDKRTIHSHHVIPSLNLFKRSRELIQRGARLESLSASEVDLTHILKAVEIFFFKEN